MFATTSSFFQHQYFSRSTRCVLFVVVFCCCWGSWRCSCSSCCGGCCSCFLSCLPSASAPSGFEMYKTCQNLHIWTLFVWVHIFSVHLSYVLKHSLNVDCWYCIHRSFFSWTCHGISPELRKIPGTCRKSVHVAEIWRKQSELLWKLKKGNIVNEIGRKMGRYLVGSFKDEPPLPRGVNVQIHSLIPDRQTLCVFLLF